MLVWTQMPPTNGAKSKARSGRYRCGL